MIEVTCALIINDNGQIFAAQRSAAMSLPLKWEFPGGKIEPNENEEACLIREIKEELNIEIRVIRNLPANIHHYPTVSIRLIPFVCEICYGTIELKEHADFKWIDKNELLDLDWAEADIPIVKNYLNV